ncbi:hypothetical protein LguiA_001090 [Lonicera macranthoides]
MGALTSNRKRGDDYFASNYKLQSLNPYSHISKKPKFSSSMHQNPDLPVSSKSAASRIHRYPEPSQRIPREVHAPCRTSRFGFFAKRNSTNVVNNSAIDANAMGNTTSNNYYDRAKKIAVSTLHYFKKEKDVVDIEEETVREEVSEDSDSSIEVIEIEENEEENNGIVDNSMETDYKVGVAGRDFQHSSSSVDSDLTNSKVDSAGKMLDLLSLKEPLHKQLYESVKRRDSKLSNLDFQIQYNERQREIYQLLRPSKKQEEDVVREPVMPLTKEEGAEVARALSNSNRRKVLVNHVNSNIQITGELLQCLRPGAWLNDEVINLYLELLKEREKREPKRFLKCHFFNTFFYKKLYGRSGYDFKSVRRWTTQRKLGYSLIECDKIFVPIHKEVHWCLAVINMKDEKFQYLDSLRGRDKQVMKVLARYIADEVKDKSGKDINVSSWKQEYVEDLPDQENGFDCGMFMIKYIDFYSRDVGLCFNQEHMPYFRLRTAKEILQLKAD